MLKTIPDKELGEFLKKGISITGLSSERTSMLSALFIRLQQNEFTCPDCPFTSNDATNMAIHRIHHRPNLEAIFKCYLCPYYVSTKA